MATAFWASIWKTFTPFTNGWKSIKSSFQSHAPKTSRVSGSKSAQRRYRKEQGRSSNFVVLAICSAVVGLAVIILVTTLVLVLRPKNNPLLEPTKIPALIECFEEDDESDYRGLVNMTQDGDNCGSWTDQTVHEHTRTPEKYPNSGLGDHNYCRNPDGDVGAWCYTTKLDKRWAYCDVGKPSDDCKISECFEAEDGSDYRGIVNITKDGENCSVWIDQTIHYHSRTPRNFPFGGLGDHNYCRNPDGDDGVWCYTTNPEVRWDYCYVGEPREDCSECYTDFNGTDYRGAVNTTTNGTECQKWTSLTPHNHSDTPSEHTETGLGNHNFCRNPDNSDGAWCYTTDPGIRVGKCDIGVPSIFWDLTNECFKESDASDYRGKVSTTISGKTCQKWTDQTPHSHTRTPANFPTAGLGNHNYCRNPDEKVQTWCYTTTPSKRWELCYVGEPYDNCIGTTASHYESSFASYAPKTGEYNLHILCYVHMLLCSFILIIFRLTRNNPLVQRSSPTVPEAYYRFSMQKWKYFTRCLFSQDTAPYQTVISKARNVESRNIDKITTWSSHVTSDLCNGVNAMTTTLYNEETIIPSNYHKVTTLLHDNSPTPTDIYCCSHCDIYYVCVICNTWAFTMVQAGNCSNFLVIAVCIAAVGVAIALLVVILVLVFRDTDQPVEISECYEEKDGSDYRGVVNITKDGENCAVWIDQTIHYHSRTPRNFPFGGLGDHNYCRNPDGDDGVWCYTTNPEVRWNYCYVGEPREDCSECYTDFNGTDYRGAVNTTTDGTECQKWTSLTPHNHSDTPSENPGTGLGDHNFCRNPDNSDGAWCYTTDPSIRVGKCDIGVPSDFCDECFKEPDVSDYRGKVSTTISGKTCQKWTDQTPHSHTRTPANFPTAGLGNHNYCRNPDAEVQTWCYTTTPSKRWELCYVGEPYDNCST
ncbi:apolipoprotein(a)-like [Saccoglossus kowalevskii]